MDSPGKNAGVGCHSLLQGIFQTQGLKLGLLHYRYILYHLSHQGSPMTPLWHSIPSICFVYISHNIYHHLTLTFMHVWLLLSQTAQWVTNLLAIQKTQEMWDWSLGQENSLGKEMGTHFSILAWKLPWAEGTGGLQSKGSQRVYHQSPQENVHFMRTWNLSVSLLVTSPESCSESDACTCSINNWSKSMNK